MAAGKLSRYVSRTLWASCSLLFALYYFWSSIQTALVIFRMPLAWNRSCSEFIISQEADSFDVTFLNYSRTKDTSLPDYPDLVPPILHHISLGEPPRNEAWVDAKRSCYNYHEGWEKHVWTDENVGEFLEEHFPDYQEIWENYKYPIQRIDALRYMVLYVYGGVVLDMDLKCTRSLGPLRRFNFVAPAAQPKGFSIGFMMASPQHPFVGELIRNLPTYDKNWFWLPYPTVMFSTGCHYASAIHTIQSDRSVLKILAGPKEDPKLHSLNGDVVTPLFHHLGSSSWHSYDAALIVTVKRSSVWVRVFAVGIMLTGVGYVVYRVRWRGNGEYLRLWGQRKIRI